MLPFVPLSVSRRKWYELPAVSNKKNGGQVCWLPSFVGERVNEATGRTSAIGPVAESRNRPCGRITETSSYFQGRNVLLEATLRIVAEDNREQYA